MTNLLSVTPVKPPKQKSIQETCEPKHLALLCSQLKSSKFVAKLIGSKTSTISAYLRANSCPVFIDLAASTFLEKEENKEETVIIFSKMTREQLKSFDPWFAMAKVDYVVMDDKK